MIDKISLSITDYEVDKNTKLELISGNTELSTGEIKGSFNLFDMNGETIYGKKAFYNNELFQTDIQQFKGQSYLTVQFSPTKVFHKKDNFAPITRDQTKETYNFIQSGLNEAGIKCNIYEAEMKRIDLFNNANLDYKFRHYEPLLSVLKCKRQMNKTDFGGTGYLFNNSVQETAIYDKIEEQKDKIIQSIKNDYKAEHGNIPKIDFINAELKKRISEYPDNVGRFEQRLKSKAKIFNIFGFNSLKETTNNYDILTNYYVKSMNEGLFKFSFDEIKIMTAESLTSGIEYYFNRYKRDWFGKFLSEYGLKSLLQICSIETILEATGMVMRANGNTENNIRVKLHRLKKDIELTEAKIMLFDNSLNDTGLTNIKLYNELKEKVLKVA